MNDTAIHLDHIGKQYRLGCEPGYKTLRDVLGNWMSRRSRLARKQRENAHRFWALKDLSFEVKDGEVVGLIGRNGAGKSTLLKVLSRITEPTTGRAIIQGRVGSLLEVGSGFHPELSGRENIYLNGAMLGMRRLEIKRRLDEIIAFAEVDRFVDTPVKHYSSGMYLRLAFAVAAHLEPEILLVDEVLAVGDAAFQRKCLGKMNDVANAGRTVLFVSHNMVALRSLCQRALWIDQGSLVMDGPATPIISKYLQQNLSVRMHACWPDNETAPGNPEVRLLDAQVLPGAASPMIYIETPVTISIKYRVTQPCVLMNVSLAVYNSEDICVFNTISPPLYRSPGIVQEVCAVPGNLLNDGSYRVRVMLVKEARTLLVDYRDAVCFDVLEAGRSVNWYGKWVGVVRPDLAWAGQFWPASNGDRSGDRLPQPDG